MQILFRYRLLLAGLKSFYQIVKHIVTDCTKSKIWNSRATNQSGKVFSCVKSKRRGTL